MTTTNNENEDSCKFHPALIKKIFHEINLTPEAVSALGALLQSFVQQAIQMAEVEAECEHEMGSGDDAMVRSDHIAKIAAELFMEFS